jgi:hypothetical protein
MTDMGASTGSVIPHLAPRQHPAKPSYRNHHPGCRRQPVLRSAGGVAAPYGRRAALGLRAALEHQVVTANGNRRYQQLANEPVGWLELSGDPGRP